MKKRTGIFGGSFDPVHTGHVNLARSFLACGIIDHLLVLLTPDPPHKTDRVKSPYVHRMEMLKLAFTNMDGITISDLEVALPQPSYTLQTIDYLQKNYPDTCFYLCMGEDSLAHFHTWHRYLDIIDKADLLVAERPGYNGMNITDEIKESVIFVEHVPADVSSTQIRVNARRNTNPLFLNCPEPVIEYILTHQLYGFHQNDKGT